MQNTQESSPSPGGIFTNLDALRLSPEAVGDIAPEILSTIPVRKPKRQEYFRAHPDESYTLTTTAYFDSQVREVYMVAPAARLALAGGDEGSHLRAGEDAARGGLHSPRRTADR